MAPHRPCGNCGKQKMRPHGVRGPFPWKEYSSVILVQEIKLLQCQNCSEVALKPGDSERVDHAVEASIRAMAGFFITVILKREKCSQILVAQRLGLTQEHLSALKNGAKTPSLQTFNMLKIFAEDPRAFQISDPNFKPRISDKDLPIASFNAALKKLA